MPDGAHVEQDQPFAEMEAMKQIMLLSAPAAGRVHFRVAEACALAAGDVVADLELDHPDAVARGQPFTDGWPALASPQVESDSIQHVYTDAQRAAEMVLAGFAEDADGALASLLEVLDSDDLPYALWEEQWGCLRPLVPDSVRERVDKVVAQSKDCDGGAGGGSGAEGGCTAFPADAVQWALDECVCSAPIAEQRLLESATARARSLLEQLAGGAGAIARHVARQLLDRFQETEAPFLRSEAQADAVTALRREHAANLQTVIDALVSHAALPTKARFTLGILHTLVAPTPQLFRRQLTQLAALPPARPLARVVQRAQQLLEASLLAQLSDEISVALVPPADSNSGGSPPITGAPSLRDGGRSTGLLRSGSVLSLTGTQRELRLVVSQVARELQAVSTLEDKCAPSWQSVQ